MALKNTLLAKMNEATPGARWTMVPTTGGVEANGSATDQA